MSTANELPVSGELEGQWDLAWPRCAVNCESQLAWLGRPGWRLEDFCDPLGDLGSTLCGRGVRGGEYKYFIASSRTSKCIYVVCMSGRCGRPVCGYDYMWAYYLADSVVCWPLCIHNDCPHSTRQLSEDHQLNLLEIYVILKWQIMIRSGGNFAHAMTLELSWHAQNCPLIGSPVSELQQENYNYGVIKCLKWDFQVVATIACVCE